MITKISEYASEISGLYIDSLKKENASLKDRLKHEVEMIESAANDEIKKLKEENARLREALGFYADGASWQPYNFGDEIPMRSDREDIYSVCGMKARQALKGSEE